MQIDFHYSTMRVLLEKVGFSAEDAQIVSYSCQYVDDATDHKKMNVEGQLDILSTRFTEETFDPICTSHKGIQFLKGFSKDVRTKIYIPFHFLPDLENSKEMVVTKNGALPQKLVYRALTELSKSTGEERVMNLISLGITLHTYSDTWSHQGFSGQHNSTENDIEDIELFENGKWKKIPAVEQFELNSFPDIGHAEAGSYPDQSHLKWRYTKESNKVRYERDNTLLFLEAAENIFNLVKGTKKDDTWTALKQKLHECFSFEPESLQVKFEKFQRVFPEIGFYYDPVQWRNEALQLVENSKFLHALKDDKPHYILGSDKKWFYFHLAALEQRMYVLQLLEDNKLI
ncbi:MAG: DUF6765 family protein [Bacteroidales bacterium]